MITAEAIPGILEGLAPEYMDTMYPKFAEKKKTLAAGRSLKEQYGRLPKAEGTDPFQDFSKLRGEAREFAEENLRSLLNQSEVKAGLENWNLFKVSRFLDAHACRISVIQFV